MPIYGKGETEAIIRIIFHHLKGWNLTEMLIHSKDELSDFIKGEIDAILERLVQNEPIQYILEEARFYGMDLKVKPGVLIPRRETEELIDIIVDDFKDKEDLEILDICTGSGCIAIALARNLPFSKVDALDNSAEAMEIAGENVNNLKVKVNLLEADVFSWNPDKKYDIIVSNPPYVMDREIIGMEKNVLDYEPHEALFVRDETPLVFYDRIGDIATQALKKDGKLYFEINPLTSTDLKKLISDKGFSSIEILRDSSGKERFLKAEI